jgi:hypothetical protein
MKTSSFLSLACGLVLLISGTPCWAQKHGAKFLLEDHPEAETDVILHGPSSHVPVAAYSKKPLLTGYWIVETTFTPQNYSIVRFYDSHDTPLYTERLADFLLDSNKRARRRAFRHLSIALEHILREPVIPASATTLLAQKLQSRGKRKFADLNGPPLAKAFK